MAVEVVEAAGTAQVFAAAWEAYLSELRGWMRGTFEGLQAEDWEDIEQEVALEAWRAFRPERGVRPESVTAFLRKITKGRWHQQRSTAVRKARKRARINKLEIPFDVAGTDCPLD